MKSVAHGLVHRSTIVKKFAFGCSLILGVGFAPASSASFLDDLMGSIQNAGASLFRGQECKDNTLYISSGQVPAFFEEGKRLLKSNPCQAANYFNAIISSGQNSLTGLSHLYLIDAYSSAGDTIGALNAGTDYIKQGKDKILLAEARWRMISIIGQNIEQKSDIEPYWAKMALGIHEDQDSSNPLFQNFVISNYLAEYPQSPYARQALAFHQRAYNVVSEHFLGIAKYYYNQKEYKATIIRLQPLWAQGPQLELFPEVLFISVKSYVDFARQVADVRDGKTQNFLSNILGGKPMTESRLKDLLGLSYNQSINYNQEIQNLLTQARTIHEMMKDGLPNSPWTQKAGEYLSK